MSASKPTKTIIRNRSAITGRYVKPSVAIRSPKTTVREVTKVVKGVKK